jgi:hypothetical protein
VRIYFAPPLNVQQLSALPSQYLGVDSGSP